jgi:ABC-2 type transport system permease protein
MTLIPAAPRGALTGFRTLLDRELGTWWRTRRWLVHALFWPGVVAAFLLLVRLEQGGDTAPAEGLREATQLFFQLGGFFGLIGAVLAAQGAIVGERRSGTAAWVLTKPVTRKAFVLAKFTGIVLSFLTLSLLLPAVTWHLQVQAQWGVLPAPAHFLEALGLLALHQAFYVAFTLMLGTLFAHRGAVAGTALGFWIAGTILLNQVPLWVSALLPWPLISAAAQVALWRPVPVVLWQTALAVAAWLVLCLAVALLRFEREEF